MSTKQAACITSQTPTNSTKQKGLVLHLPSSCTVPHYYDRNDTLAMNVSLYRIRFGDYYVIMFQETNEPQNEYLVRNNVSEKFLFKGPLMIEKMPDYELIWKEDDGRSSYKVYYKDIEEDIHLRLGEILTEQKYIKHFASDTLPSQTPFPKSYL